MEGDEPNWNRLEPISILETSGNPLKRPRRRSPHILMSSGWSWSRGGGQHKQKFRLGFKTPLINPIGRLVQQKSWKANWSCVLVCFSFLFSFFFYLLKQKWQVKSRSMKKTDIKDKRKNLFVLLNKCQPKWWEWGRKKGFMEPKEAPPFVTILIFFL